MQGLEVTHRLEAPESTRSDHRPARTVWGRWESVRVEESCADAAALYRGKLDCPCTGHGHAVWTLAGEALDAVDLPFGLPVLDARLPVIEVPGELSYWRFPVRPQRNVPLGLLAEVARRGGRYLGNGELIELPPTRVPGGELRWHQGTDGNLPTLADVIAMFALLSRSVP